MAAPSKFQVPPKPDDADIAGSIDESDYQYEDEDGKPRFWQGFDSKFKSTLMATSRAVPATPESRKARTILINRGWSTKDREEAATARRRGKIERARERLAKLTHAA